MDTPPPSSPDSPSRREPTQPRLVVIFILAAIILILMVVNFLSSEKTPPAIPTRALMTGMPADTSTSTSTATITLTPRPSWTLRPSATVTPTFSPTPTLTPTRYPTLTPAKPNKDNWRYVLKDWSVTDAERLARQIQAKEVFSGLPAVWYPAAAYAQAEALMRYPESLQAAQWEWDLAASLAYTNDPLAAQRYARLIQSALEARQIRIEDLPAWFQLYQSDLSLTLHPLTSLPGELSRQLVEISGAGSAYLWLLETPTSIQVVPLLSDFDYVNDLQNDFVLADLTGDGIDEISIYRTATPGQFTYLRPRIFNQAQIPPVELRVVEELPFDFATDYRTKLNPHAQAGGGNDLQFSATLFPACPVTITHTYHWSGERFETAPVQFAITPVPGLEAACELAVEHAARAWGTEAALLLAESILPVWPPQTDLEGKAYPADALDAWHFRLAIYQALSGKHAEALQTLNELVSNPNLPASNWPKLAQQFLDRYLAPEDLYTACQDMPFCNLREALQRLIAGSNLTDLSQASGYLGQHGVVIRASGVFDFDGDGEDERWVSVLPGAMQKLEFWILAQVPGGIQAVFVQIIDDNSPTPYYFEPRGVYPVVQFEAKQGFRMRRLPDIQTAFIEQVTTEAARPTYIRDAIHSIAQRLLDGTNPATILDELLDLQADPRFRADCLAFYVCGKFLYTLGLTYELLGQADLAVDTYLYLWRDFPTSPYTVMARMKMIYNPPPPTATNTPTPTRTVTPTHDPNSTATRTPTVTSTIDPFATPSETPSESATPTRTPTKTPEGYPYP